MASTASILAGQTTENLEVTVSSVAPVGADYRQAQATMSGTVIRDDGSQGDYKVPMSFLYPEDATRCNGIGIVDVVNSVLYETFETTGTNADPFFPSLFPFALLILGDEFIQNNGYVYASAQWNKLVVDRQRAAGTLSDTSLQIDRGRDGDVILRDLSDFLRTPAAFLGENIAAPCAVDDAVSFGFSQTGMLLRRFHFQGMNATLAVGPGFDEGLVFEGSVHGVPGSHCRSLSDASPFFSYTFRGCGGETPASQGLVVTINTETDVQFINGWRARPQGSNDSDDGDDDDGDDDGDDDDDDGDDDGDDGQGGDDDGSHYRLYEVAGTSHLWTSLIPLKASGIRPPGSAAQNYADVAPLFRASMDHLDAWIAGAGEAPPSAVLKGHIGSLSAPLFSSNSWGADNRQVFVTELGDDGNVLGGVRLPHVRTRLPGASEIGGPLGLYRGTECENDPSSADFILSCGLQGDENIYNMAGGSFTPYVESDPGRCTTLYPSRQDFINAVSDAAEHAAAKGWVPVSEIDALVDAAIQKADEFPGCVPES